MEMRFQKSYREILSQIDMNLLLRSLVFASTILCFRRPSYLGNVTLGFFRLSNFFACRFLIFGCLLSNLSTSLHAGDFIEWKQPHATAVIDNGEDPTTFVIQFKNFSTQFDIKINRILTECGCARLLADKEKYGPSEEGIILGTLLVSDELTFNKKQILVEGEILSGGVGVSFAEKIDLYILKSESIRLSNPTLRWGLNSSKSPKATEVISSSAQPVSIRVLNENIKLDWDLTVVDGSGGIASTHSLHVAPRSTELPLRVVVELIVSLVGHDSEREYLTLIVE